MNSQLKKDLAYLKKNYPNGVWKVFPLDDYVFVNDQGFVATRYRFINGLNFTKKKPVEILDTPIICKNVNKNPKDKTGYVDVNGVGNGNNFRSLYRYVALTFCKNPLNKKYVNHIDSNKQNNKASNLEWVTSKENFIHMLDSNPDFQIRRAATMKEVHKNPVVKAFHKMRTAEGMSKLYKRKMTIGGIWVCDDIEYATLRSAQKATRMGKTKLVNICNNNLWPGYYYYFNDGKYAHDLLKKLNKK